MTQPVVPEPTQPVAAPPPPADTSAQQPPILGVKDLSSIPEDQLTGAFKSGQVAFRANENIPIRLADGRLATVGAEDLSQMVDAGAQIVHPEVVHTAELEAKYGGMSGALGAGLAGGARGLTLGLSDPVALAAVEAYGGKQARESLRERLQGYQEVHPFATGVGELAGIAAPALFTGGAAGAVEGAGALARAGEVGGSLVRGAGILNEGVSAVGRGAERLAERVVGKEAESLIARAGQKAVTKAASGAAEAALFGAGQEVSESALGDHELTAEKVLSSMGHAAALGGLLGGGLGAGGELGGAALNKVRAKASPYLSTKAEEEAFKSLNGRKLFTKQAEKIDGGTRAVGRTLLDKVGLKAGDTVETIAPKVDAALNEAGDRITSQVAKVGKVEITLKEAEDALEARAKEADKLMGHEGQSNAIRDGIKSLRRTFAPFEAAAEGEAKLGVPEHLEAQRPAIDALWKAAQKPGGEEAMQTLKGMGVEIKMPKAPVPFDPAKVKIPLEDLLQARRTFESTIDWQRDGNLITQGKRAVGRTLEDLLVERGEQAAKEAGLDGFATEYKAAKLEYRRLKVAADAVNDAVTRKLANAEHSLTDKIMAGHGLSGGIMHGLSSGHLLAGGLHGVVGGMTAGQASKIVRERANASLAVWFDKLATLQSVARRVDTVDATIAKGVKGFMRRAEGAEGGAAAAKPKLKLKTFSRSQEEPREEYDRRMADLKAAAAGVDHSPLSSQIAQHAPMTAASVAERAQNATTWLASQAPKPPKWGTQQPSDQEISVFNAKARAVDRPVETLAAGLAHGGLTKTEVDAVKATAPKIFETFQQQIDQQIQLAIAQDKTIPYPLKRDLALLFGAESTWSMTGEGVKSLQQAAQAAPDQQQKAPMGGARRKAVQTPNARQVETPAERRQGGEIR